MWPFVTKKKYQELHKKYEAVLYEKKETWNLFYTLNDKYIQLAKENSFLKLDNMKKKEEPTKEPPNEYPKALVVPNRTAVSPKAVRTVNNDYVTPAGPQRHVVFLGDTFSPSMLDSSFVGSGGSFGGGGASASWSDDSCSKSYGGTDVSDVNSCSSTDSNISSSQ